MWNRVLNGFIFCDGFWVWRVIGFVGPHHDKKNARKVRIETWIEMHRWAFALPSALLYFAIPDGQTDRQTRAYNE